MHSSCPKCGASVTGGGKTCGSCGAVSCFLLSVLLAFLGFGSDACGGTVNGCCVSVSDELNADHGFRRGVGLSAVGVWKCGWCGFMVGDGIGS